jgi:hypothetical protein
VRGRVSEIGHAATGHATAAPPLAAPVAAAPACDGGDGVDIPPLHTRRRRRIVPPRRQRHLTRGFRFNAPLLTQGGGA